MSNDGGPAFPVGNTATASDDLYPDLPGMTLRDYFAGQALAGINSDLRRLRDLAHAYAEDNVSIAEALATECYVMADAMLAARALIAELDGEEEAARKEVQND